MLLHKEREQVAELGRRMSVAGLSTGTSGNISVYVPEEGLMAISPSGMDYFAVQPEDFVKDCNEYGQGYGYGRCCGDAPEG